MIDRNTISTRDQHVIRVVGAVGVGGVGTTDNVLRVVLSRNLLSGSMPSVAVQAAASIPGSTTDDNVVGLRLLENQVGGAPEQAFVVSDGSGG